MEIRKPSPNQASVLPAVHLAWDPAKEAEIRLTQGDFRLILHALYILQETEIDPLNRRQRIRIGLITMHIHDALVRSSRQSRN